MEEKKLTMKQLPEGERPYEKLEHYGASALSDAELLAVLLRSGTRQEKVTDVAVRLLTQAAEHSELSGLSALFSLSVPQLASMSGIGRVRAVQLKAVLEICARLHRDRASEALVAGCPEQIADAYMDMLRYRPTEVLKILYLNNRHRKILEVDMAEGSENAAFFNLSAVIRTALEHHATRLILMHNHPGGDPSPSDEDIQTTRQVAQACQLVNLKLLDHIIIGGGTYYSFKEEGLLDSP